MKWAHSDRTIIGEQKFFYKNNKWVLLEKSDDSFVEMGTFTDKERDELIQEIIARNEELHYGRRDGEIHNSIDGYRNVKDEYSRYFSDAMGEFGSDGQSSRLHRSKSESYGIANNQSGKSIGRVEVKQSPRTTVTTGQYEQMKANLSHSKVP